MCFGQRLQLACRRRQRRMPRGWPEQRPLMPDLRVPHGTRRQNPSRGRRQRTPTSRRSRRAQPRVPARNLSTALRDPSSGRRHQNQPGVSVQERQMARVPHACAQHGQESIDSAARRRVRGFAAAAVFTAILLTVFNLRTIATFLKEEHAQAEKDQPSDPSHRLRRRRDRVSTNTYTGTVPSEPVILLYHEGKLASPLRT